MAVEEPLELAGGGAIRGSLGDAHGLHERGVAYGLLLTRGHLHAATPTDNTRLAREIGGALTPGAARRQAQDGFALVKRPSGRPAWAVSVVPLPQRVRSGPAGPPPTAIVSIAETVPRVRPERLRQGFNLSVAESEIAASLAGGMQLNEIAEARGASLETVRGQLKGIFAKLGVSTQAQLVGRIATATDMVWSSHSR